MNDFKYLKWNENLVYYTLCVITVLGLLYGNSYNIILFCFIILIVISGNAKRIYSKKYLSLARTIRRICFLLPLYAVIYFGFKAEWNSKVIFFCLVGAIFSLLMIGISYRSWRLYLAKAVILMEAEESYNEYLTRIFYLAGTAIGEEIFFRNFMIGFAPNPYIMLIVSTQAFVCQHVGTKWSNRFTFQDVIRQLIFGLFSGYLFILSGSCWPCIFSHLIFNMPHIIAKVKCIYYKKNKSFQV